MDTSKNPSSSSPTVNLVTLTEVISDTAHSARTGEQKKLLYNLCYELARRIGKTDHTGNFQENEFLKHCGINPEWKEAAA